MTLSDIFKAGAKKQPKDRDKLSEPQFFLWSMLVFTAIVILISISLIRQIVPAFLTNPGLNGLIIGVLLTGFFLAFGQITKLFREIKWINSFQKNNTTIEPVLLLPMKAMLSRSSSGDFCTSSIETMLSSIANRLDEGRDILRYLIGLLVFLGLLGTFWGLLGTIGSIRETLNTLSPTGEALSALNALKSGLSAPLAGMGTAFSSSLFGLSGSLILGFLDLQAGRAQTRFYTELENWLAEQTDHSPRKDTSKINTTATEDIRDLMDKIRSIQRADDFIQPTISAIGNLSEGITGLVQNMLNEQELIRSWIEEESQERKKLHITLQKIKALIEERKQT